MMMKMNNKDYYPEGAANNPNAPFNEIEIPLKKFDCSVSTTISRPIQIVTNEYYLEKDEEDGSIRAVTDDVNWNEEYKEQHYTIPQLLEAFSTMCNDLIRVGYPVYSKSLLRKFIKECDGWTEDETEVIEE